MLHRAQSDNNRRRRIWTVDASLETVFKLDTVRIFDCDQILIKCRFLTWNKGGERS